MTGRRISDGYVVWLTGLSGAGKSTIAVALRNSLRDRNVNTVVLDGDNLRTGLNADLGYSAEDRTENLRRMAHVADLFRKQGFVVIVATISPEQKHRDRAREIAGTNFIEVFIDTPLHIFESRDPKGLYERARAGTIKNFTGIAAPYEVPHNPDLSINTKELSIEECSNKIFSFLVGDVSLATSAPPPSSLASANNVE